MCICVCMCVCLCVCVCIYIQVIHHHKRVWKISPLTSTFINIVLIKTLIQLSTSRSLASAYKHIYPYFPLLYNDNVYLREVVKEKIDTWNFEWLNSLSHELRVYFTPPESILSPLLHNQKGRKQVKHTNHIFA